MKAIVIIFECSLRFPTSLELDDWHPKSTSLMSARDIISPAQYHMHGGEPATVERDDMNYGDINTPAGAGSTSTTTHPHAVDTTKIMRQVSWRILPLLALAVRANTHYKSQS